MFCNHSLVGSLSATQIWNKMNVFKYCFQAAIIFNIQNKTKTFTFNFNNGFPTKNNQYFSGQNSWGIGVQSL